MKESNLLQCLDASNLNGWAMSQALPTDNFHWISELEFISEKIAKLFKKKKHGYILQVGLSPIKKNCFICFNESPLKMVKNIFYFILRALFDLKMFKLLSWLFGDIGKTSFYEYKVNFKVYYVTTWLTSNYNTNIAQYCTK